MSRPTLDEFRSLSPDAKLEAIFQAIGTAAQPAQGPRAYELPAMAASDPGLITDGQTTNRDGSIWRKRPAIPGRQEAGFTCVRYGYISRAKNPRLFERMIPALCGADAPRIFAELDRDPYMTYVASPEVFLDEGYVLPGDPNPEGRQPVNFMMFAAALQPTGFSVKQ